MEGPVSTSPVAPRRAARGSPRGTLPSGFRVLQRRHASSSAIEDPQPLPVIPSSLHSAPRHHPAARDQRRQTCKAKIQCLSDCYFQIDIAEVRTKEGKLYLFVAIDRTSNLAFVPLHEQADRSTAVSFRTGTKHLASHQTTAEGWLRRHSLVKNHKSGQNSP